MKKHGSEQVFWGKLQEQLQPGEVVLRNVRFTDPRHGDVEADFLYFMPDAGVAVIEVKGGTVTFENDEWLMTNKDFTRRIHPVEQARRAKHAMRRYLDRQPEWNHGLVKSEWLVAFPFTTVEADMGPQAPREHIIGDGDLDRIREIARAKLLSPLDTDRVPTSEWVDEALSLILRLNHNPRSATNDTDEEVSQPRWIPVLGAAAFAIIIGVIAFALTHLDNGLATAAVAIAIVATAITFGIRQRKKMWTRRLSKTLTAGAALGLLIGGVAGVALRSPAAVTNACLPGYSPCVPQGADLDCNHLNFKVKVSGTDPFNLDHDGDGWGCETRASNTP